LTRYFDDLIQFIDNSAFTLLEAAIIPTEKYFSALLTRYFDDLIQFIDNSAFPTSLLKAEPTYFVSKWRPYVMPRPPTIFSVAVRLL